MPKIYLNANSNVVLSLHVTEKKANKSVLLFFTPAQEKK